MAPQDLYKGGATVMEWLLSKKNKLCLDLFRYLVSQPHDTVVIQDIICDMGISRYQVIETVKQLSLDTTKIGRIKMIYIKMIDFNHAVEIENLRLITDASLLGYYIRLSLQFDILVDVFLEKASSNNDIAYRHASSTSAVRLARSDLVKSLADRDIAIKKSGNYMLVGDEKNIRMLLFESLYTAYSDFSAPLPSYVNVATQRLEELQSLTGELGPTAEKALSIFFNVWAVRMRNEHFIVESCSRLFTPKDSMTPVANKLLSVLTQMGETILGYNSKKATKEAYFALTALHSAGIGINTNRSDNYIKPVITTLDSIYAEISAAHEKLFKVPVSEEAMQKIKTYLFAFNLRMMFFKQSGITHPVKLDDARNAYPAHVALTEQVLKQVAPILGFTAAEFYEQAANEYLHAFISSLEKTAILPLVTLSIDTLSAPALEAIIKDRILRWPNLNVKIAKEITASTDIYIADVQLTDKIPGFAWRFMPDDKNFNMLHQELIDITWKKLDKSEWGYQCFSQQ